MCLMVLKKQTLKLNAEPLQHPSRLLLSLIALLLIDTDVRLLFLLIIAEHLNIERLSHLILNHLLQFDLSIEQLCHLLLFSIGIYELDFRVFALFPLHVVLAHPVPLSHPVPL